MMRLYCLIACLLLASQIAAQTTVTLKPAAAQGKDSEVWDFTPTTNRGSNQAINVYTWTRSGSPTVKRSYVEFDLSSIPANSIVQSAKLKLFYDPITNEGFSNHSGVTDFEIRRVSSSWVENTINWSNQPSVSNLNMVDVPAHTSNSQNYNIEVGDLVNDMLRSGNFGFQLRMKNETNPLRGLLFASSDHPNSNLHPELEVTYVPGNINRVTSMKDAKVWSGNPNANYGSVPYLVSYTFQSSGPVRLKRFYIEFDLSTIPPGAKLDSAFMNLFFSASPNEGFPTHTGGTEMEINRVTLPWLDSTINWNNQPTVDTSLTINVPAHQTPTQDYRIDVTSLVAGMRQYGNNGFRVKMQNEQVAFRGVMFASAEHPSPSLRPFLDVFWSLNTSVDEALSSVEPLFEIYPNPSEGIVNLSVGDLSSLEQVQIFDTNGKLVRTFNMPRSNSLDLSKMAEGLYFMRVQFESGEIVSKKFILR